MTAFLLRANRWFGRLMACCGLMALCAPSVQAAGPAPATAAQTGRGTLLVPPPSRVQEIKPPQLPRHFETDAGAVSRKLDELIREALRRNPALLASRESLSAAEHRILPAGVPADPILGFRMKDLPTTFSMTRENATEKQIEVEQRYPFPGKLALREKIAKRSAEETRELMRLATVRLITEVRSAFADIFLADKDIEVALEHQRRLRDLVDIATSKYRVGPGLQQDVLNADVALARLTSTLIELARRRKTRELKLAALLDSDRVEVPPLGTLPAAALKHSPAELEQMVIETNPEIHARQRAVERAQAAVRLARIAPLPDMVLGGAYGSRNDHPLPAPAAARYRPDLLTGLVMFDIPIFYYSKQREQLAEAQANLRQSEALLAAARRNAVEQLHDLLVRLSQHERVAASFRNEVVPVARAAVAASVSAYQVNKVDFLTLLAAQDNLDSYQAEYWRNEAERFRDIAQIDEVTGAVLVENGWGI